MGGKNEYNYYLDKVYSVSLQALVSQLCSLDSRDSSKKLQIWKEISGLGTTCSTPLCIDGSLFAIGGLSNVTAIQLYQPDMRKWVKVGDLPTPRHNCTCAMYTNREMIVAEGDPPNESQTSLVDICSQKLEVN